MGCVDTHQGGLAMKRCDSPSRIRSIVEKIGEYNKKKVGNIGLIICQTFTQRAKHDNIWAQDVSQP
jgi:hypothetical protein